MNCQKVKRIFDSCKSEQNEASKSIDMNEATLILVDDHALYRDGVRKALEETPMPLSIIAECASGKELYDFLLSNATPDLILLDIMLPDTSGIEIARKLKTEYPNVKIIMLSSEVSADIVTELIEINVEGYLSKLAQKQDIIKAIMTVLAGNHYYGQSVAKIMCDVYLAKKHHPDNRKNIFSKKREEILTTREEEIVRYLCDGYLAKEVADKLNLSVRTVETHKSNILKKLGFNNMVELVRYAMKVGIVEL